MAPTPKIVRELDALREDVRSTRLIVLDLQIKAEHRLQILDDLDEITALADQIQARATDYRIQPRPARTKNEKIQCPGCKKYFNGKIGIAVHQRQCAKAQRFLDAMKLKKGLDDAEEIAHKKPGS